MDKRGFGEDYRFLLERKVLKWVVSFIRTKVFFMCFYISALYNSRRRENSAYYLLVRRFYKSRSIYKYARLFSSISSLFIPYQFLRASFYKRKLLLIYFVKDYVEFMSIWRYLFKYSSAFHSGTWGSIPEVMPFFICDKKGYLFR